MDTLSAFQLTVPAEFVYPIVLDDGVQAALHELGRDAHHRLGAEPGREGGGHHHDQRQAAPGDGEVAGVLDAGARPHAQGQGAQQVEHDESDQHGRLVARRGEDDGPMKTAARV